MSGSEGMNTKPQECRLLLYLNLAAAAQTSLLGRNLSSITIIIVSDGKVKNTWPALKLQDLIPIPIPTENQKTTEELEFSNL